jgi:hypothetical protein
VRERTAFQPVITGNREGIHPDELKTLSQEDDSFTEGSEDADEFMVGGKHGFHTNIDDFLQRFTAIANELPA